MKYRVSTDVTIALGADHSEQTFKAGQHTVNEKNRAALERLADMGLAEQVSTAKEE